MYKFYISHQDLKPGSAFTFERCECLNSSPFSTFDDLAEPSPEAVLNAIQNQSKDRPALKEIIRRTNTSNRTFFFAESLADLYRFLEIDPSTMLHVIGKTNLPESHFLYKMLSSSRFDSNVLSLFIHFKNSEYEWNFDESSHFWCPDIMNTTDFKKFYGNSFVKKCCYGGDSVIRLDFPLTSADLKGEKYNLRWGLHKVLKDCGFKCSDEYFMEDYSMSSEESARIVHSKKFSALCFSSPNVNTNAIQLNRFEHIFDFSRYFDDITKRAPTIIHAHVQIYEMGDDNSLDVFHRVSQKDLPNLLRFVSLDQSAENVLYKIRFSDQSIYLKFKEDLEQMKNEVFSKVPYILSSLSSGVYTDPKIPLFSDFLTQNTHFKDLLLERNFTKSSTSARVTAEMDPTNHTLLEKSGESSVSSGSESMVTSLSESEKEMILEDELEEGKEMRKTQNQLKKIKNTDIFFFNTPHLIGELCKLLERTVGEGQFGLEDWPYYEIEKGEPTAETHAVHYKYVLRVCKPNEILFEYKEGTYGIGIECFAIPKDIGEFLKYFDMDDNRTNKIVQLIQVEQSTYRLTAPLLREWRGKAIAPRSVSVGENLIVFHPDIQKPDKMIAEINKLKSDFEDNSSLKIALEENFKDISETYNLYDETMKNLENCCNSAIELSLKFERGMPLTPKMLRTHALRQYLHDHKSDVYKNNPKNSIDVSKFYSLLGYIEKYENHLKGEFVTICKKAEDVYNYLENNMRDIPNNMQQKGVDLKHYFRCLVFSLMGYVNPTGEMAQFSLQETFTFVYDIRAPLLKFRLFFSKPLVKPSKVKMARYIKRYALNMAESKEVQTLINRFLYDRTFDLKNLVPPWSVNDIK